MPEDLLSFLTTRIMKMTLRKITFVSEHLHSLHALSLVVLTIPARSTARVNHAKIAKHTVDCHVFFPNTHTFALTQMRRSG